MRFLPQLAEILVKIFLRESSAYRSLRESRQGEKAGVEEEGSDSDASYRSETNSMGGNTDDSTTDLLARPMIVNACKTAGKVRLYSILAIQVMVEEDEREGEMRKRVRTKRKRNER